MPLIKSHHTGSQWLLWQANEPLLFFTEKMTLNRYEEQRLEDIKHDSRAVHFACGRYLLRQLLPDVNAEKFIAVNEIPVVTDSEYHISVSHSGQWVTAMSNKDIPCGIDVQVVEERIVNIKDKFSTPAERNLAGNMYTLMQICTIIWAAKEAVFKCMQTPGLDFRTDMVVESFDTEEVCIRFTRNMKHLKVPFEIANDYVLAYCTAG
jgi:phosphopantetheinyl transferase